MKSEEVWCPFGTYLNSSGEAGYRTYSLFTITYYLFTQPPFLSLRGAISDVAIRFPLCVRQDTQKERTDSHVAALLGMTNGRCNGVIYGMAIVQQRDGRPVPYALTLSVGVIFGALRDPQRAGLEPAPTVGDGVRWDEWHHVRQRRRGRVPRPGCTLTTAHHSTV